MSHDVSVSVRHHMVMRRSFSLCFNVSVSVRHHMVMRRSFSLCFIYTFAVGTLLSSPQNAENRKSYPSGILSARLDASLSTPRP